MPKMVREISVKAKERVRKLVGGKTDLLDNVRSDGENCHTGIAQNNNSCHDVIVNVWKKCEHGSPTVMHLLHFISNWTKFDIKMVKIKQNHIVNVNMNI